MSRRVPPNPAAPKLPPRIAARVSIADDKSAAGYDAIDEALAIVANVAKEIRSDRITLEIHPVTGDKEETS